MFTLIALSYVHTNSFKLCSARKPYRIGLLFTHNNGCGGATSATEQRCAAPGLLRRQLLLETFSFKDENGYEYEI